MTLDRIRADWTRLGADDPLWAVLVRPGARHGKWDPEAFLATGRTEVAAALDRAAQLGAQPGDRCALDFGCGAGRLSQALAAYVDEVVGVDVSEPMLETARALDPAGRVRFVLNTAESLTFLETGSVDISYSSLVLQHLPPPLARGYLAELVRVLQPGGLLVVQTATAPNHSLKGQLARALPRPALRVVQQRMLGYPAPMEMHAMPSRVVAEVVEAAGGRVLAHDPAPMYGGHWSYTRHFAVKT
jgi:SAM-dependent methyltransferase